MKRHVYRFLERFSINTIVLLATVLNTFLLLTLTATILLSKYSQSNEQMAMQNTEQTTENIAKSIETFVEGKLENLEWIKNNFSVQDLSTVSELNSDIVMVAIYTESGELVRYATQEQRELKQEVVGEDKNLSFLVDAIHSENDYYISAPHVNNLFEEYYPWVVTFLTQKHVNGETFYIVMDIQFSKISQYIDKIYIGDRGYIFIADAEGNIVYHPQQQLIYTKLKEERFDILQDAKMETTMTTDANIYSFSTVAKTNWRIIGVSNMDELVIQRTKDFIEYAVVVIWCALSLSLILATVLFRGLTRPVDKLIASIHLFEKDVDLYVEQEVHGVKEFCALQHSFNHMAKRIRTLMAQVVAEEKELQKFELKALQAQINPHFLYNTLDSIFWMCQESGNHDAAHMVAALSNTFRISISRGQDEIFVRDEIKHVESYLIIQNMRYKNQFLYEFDVDPDILQYKCLKILLQPFVENAIYHGLNRMVDEGEIHIRGYKENDALCFQVSDNGVGMDAEQVAELYVRNSEKTGIGVKNVHDRIRIYYGAAYGVFVESELDEGTTVTIKVPLIETEAEDV